MNKTLKEQAMAYMTGNLSCQRVAEVVTDYLDGALPIGTRLRFHMHLGFCFACRNYLQQIKHTIETLGKLPAEPISPEIREALLQRFRGWKK